MADAYKDVIRARLDHSDIVDMHVGQQRSGVWYVSVEYAGTARNLERLVGQEFDIQDTAPNDEGGVHARLYPNIEEL